MGQVDTFEITFDNNQEVYREGDQVEGFVRIVNSDNVKYKSINCELCGVAVVRWSRVKSKDKDIDEVGSDRNKEYYFHKRLNLNEKENGVKEKNPVLSKGEHIYPFECKLPQELPSSFEGEYGQVRYYVRAVIERPRKSNVVTKKAFTVLSGLDLNFIPEAAAKIELCKYKSFHGCCSSGGSITIDWTVSRSGYVPGENIYIDGAVQNESKTTVLFSKAILYMAIDYKGGKRRKREYRKLVSVEKGETAPGDVTLWQDYLHIPPVPPTGLFRCKILDVCYELHFTASIDGRKHPIRYVKDIYIGTVPMCVKEMKSCIAGMFNQPYKESQDTLNELDRTNASQLSLTQVVSVAGAIEAKTSPTAPTLHTLERGATPSDVLLHAAEEMDTRPPPFAPDGRPEEQQPLNQPVNPSAPSTHTLMRPYPDAQGITPSFESPEWDPVSIHEQADDSQSLRGEFTYSPVYPYFNTFGVQPVMPPKTGDDV